MGTRQTQGKERALPTSCKAATRGRDERDETAVVTGLVGGGGVRRDAVRAYGVWLRAEVGGCPSMLLGSPASLLYCGVPPAHRQDACRLVHRLRLTEVFTSSEHPSRSLLTYTQYIHSACNVKFSRTQVMAEKIGNKLGSDSGGAALGPLELSVRQRPRIGGQGAL